LITVRFVARPLFVEQCIFIARTMSIKAAGKEYKVRSVGMQIAFLLLICAAGLH
jgi:hypothetical protein